MCMFRDAHIINHLVTQAAPARIPKIKVNQFPFTSGANKKQKLNVTFCGGDVVLRPQFLEFRKKLMRDVYYRECKI